MLANVIDRRENVHKAEGLDIMLEPSWQDNIVEGATQFPEDGPDTDFFIECLYNVSVSEAAEFANFLQCPVTMYCYDRNEDMPSSKRTKDGKLIMERTHFEVIEIDE